MRACAGGTGEAIADATRAGGRHASYMGRGAPTSPPHGCVCRLTRPTVGAICHRAADDGNRIGDLRSRLRAALAARHAGMARLAAVDAVMERALSPREQMLLAAVPGVLERHFERLREVELKTLADAQAAESAPAATPGAWLDVFRRDMQSVLLAELDVRFQPVEGLLAALRTR